jgi:hypothetical protein
MEPLVLLVTELFNTMPPTTWLFVLGLLISLNFIRKALF